MTRLMRMGIDGLQDPWPIRRRELFRPRLKKFVLTEREGSFILADFSGMWTNSYEAEHPLNFHPSAKDPVC